MLLHWFAPRIRSSADSLITTEMHREQDTMMVQTQQRRQEAAKGLQRSSGVLVLSLLIKMIITSISSSKTSLEYCCFLFALHVKQKYSTLMTVPYHTGNNLWLQEYFENLLKHCVEASQKADQVYSLTAFIYCEYCIMLFSDIQVIVQKLFTTKCKLYIY